MAKSKLMHIKLDKRDNVGHFFGRDKSGVVALRQGKDKKSEYGTFKGFLKGRFYNVILKLEEKQNKEGKSYKVGSNKGFGMSFYDDVEGVTHMNLYSSFNEKKPSKKPYRQYNRSMQAGRSRYGQSKGAF